MKSIVAETASACNKIPQCCFKDGKCILKGCKSLIVCCPLDPTNPHVSTVSRLKNMIKNYLTYLLFEIMFKIFGEKIYNKKTISRMGPLTVRSTVK